MIGFIIEGPDGSGKTQLIAALRAQYPDLVSKRCKSIRGGTGGTRFDGTGDGAAGWGSEAPAIVTYTRTLHDAMEGPSPFAFDRFHISEAVYGPILRHRQELPESEQLMLNSYIRQHDIQVVMCLPPFAVTLGNVRQNGRERPAYQTEGFLHQAYREFERLTPLATIVWDYTRDPVSAILAPA